MLEVGKLYNVLNYTREIIKYQNALVVEAGVVKIYWEKFDIEANLVGKLLVNNRMLEVYQVSGSYAVGTKEHLNDYSVTSHERVYIIAH